MRAMSHYILPASQIFFGLSILTCILLIPRYLTETDQGGISNYGTEPSTSPFFIFGFLSASAGAFYSAFNYRIGQSQKIGLLVLASIYLLVMASTFAYKVDNAQESRHQVAALLLVVIMAVYLTMNRKLIAKSFYSKAALTLYLAGFILGLLTLIGATTQLLTAQLLSGLSFGYLLSVSLSLKK